MHKQAEKALLPTSTGFTATSLTSKETFERIIVTATLENAEDQDLEPST